MTNSKFKEVVDDQFNICKEILCTKSTEYDFGDDRLHSFKSSAIFQHTSPIKALLGYLAKHLMSIYDMSDNPASFSNEKWTEKITDTINYLLLLKGLLIELSDLKISDTNPNR